MVAGTLLSDRYRIDRRLAVGGMGTVYVATDERLGREVAVKVLKEELAHDERFVERFRREARAAGALTHPNVANVYDFAQDGERHYMVMELVRGRDLARVLREESPLDPARSALITAQIARALQHAHAAGVVHRDIKPANVIVEEDDRAKVTDFGIARAVGDSTLTATGSVLGTAHYISPEQASGAEIGPASDIYSLGIVLYEMLTGSLPFTGDSAIGVAMRHVSDEVPAPSALNPEVSRELDEVVAHATAKEPARRFADAGALATAVEAAVTGESAAVTTPLAGPGTEVMQTVWPIPGERWDPQKLGRRVLLALGALAVIAVALLLLRLGDVREEPTRTRDATEQPAAEEPDEATGGFTVPDDIIGAEYKDAEKLLKDAGLSVDKEEVPHEAEKDTVVDSDPPPGTTLDEGEAITLIVSSGPEEDDEEDDHEDEDPPGNSEGRGKGKDKEKDD